MPNVNKILLTSCLSVILSVSSVVAQAGTTRSGANARGGISNHSFSNHGTGTHSNSRSNYHSSASSNTATRSKTSSSGNVTISQSIAYDSAHRNHSTTVTNNQTQNSVVHQGNTLHNSDNTEHDRSTTVKANGNQYNTDKHTAAGNSENTHFVDHSTNGQYVNPTGVEATHQKETYASQSGIGTAESVKQIEHSSSSQSYNHEHDAGRYRAKSTTITSGTPPTIVRTLVVQ